MTPRRTSAATQEPRPQSPLLRTRFRMHAMPRRALRSWRPAARPHPGEWADKRLWLPATSGSGPTKYLRVSFPFQAGIWDALYDPDVEEVDLWTGTQLGKTTLLMGYAEYICDADPCPMLFCGPTESSVRKLSATRLQPMFDADPYTSRLLPPAVDRNDLRLEAERNTIYFGWSGSPVTLGEISARVVLATELDKWDRSTSQEADPEKLAGERVKAFSRFKIVKESTCTIHGASRIEAAYHATDQRRFFVPCPHCGEFQTLEFEQIKVPPDVRDPAEARETAWYECRHCRATIRDAHKPLMLARGEWRETKPPKGGRKARKAGFHLNSIYSPVLTFGRIMQEFFESRHDPEKLQNFWNGWLARTWVVSGDRPQEEAILKCRGAYRRGTVPDDVRLVVAAADVQQDRVYYLVRAWGTGFRSWLVQHGVVAGMEDLKDVADKYHPVRFVVDSSYFTGDVYDFVAQARAPFYVCKGSKPETAPVKMARMDVHPKTGRTIPGGLLCYRINGAHFKRWIHAAIRRSDDDTAWLLPEDVGMDYVHQLQGEVYAKRRKPRTNQVYYEWVRVHDNHYLDCEVYATGVAWTYHAQLRRKRARRAPEGRPMRTRPIRRKY